MTPKEYLKQADRLNERINSLLTEVDELRALSFSVPTTRFRERVQTTRSNEASFVRCLTKIAKLEDKINKEIDHLIDLKIEIGEAIERVNNTEERILLRYRYVNSYSWDKIYVLMNRSKSGTHRIHSQALHHFQVPNSKVGTQMD
ncbi:DUF1492 domain-containing protein [Lactococcus insecticola]|uniref:DUF1492 domain-containing protein n=1 Tax=Pseudolactococcus insecticola TaxID=2709158 RepID=A0A6A0B4H2_9LACT|nr:DUF1492 domain-containing protein [Lactococcus insecticola]GFH40250.1 hypothetical protein Hs20B_06480 [Lactococcus insecticola]